MATYGGDEVSALVFDIGTDWTKAGYAGEDAPKALFSSWVGCVAGEKNNKQEEDVVMGEATSEQQGGPAKESSSDARDPSSSTAPKTQYYVSEGGAMSYWRPHMDMRTPIKDGLVNDWDTLEQLWDHAFYKALRVKSEEHPLLISESSWNTREIRERLAELAFEKYRVPAFFICKDAVLTAFAAGRSTALVIDSGAEMTRVVPVYDGYVLRKNIVKQPLAGRQLSEISLDQMEKDMNITVTPQYLVESKEPVDVEERAKVTLRDRPGTTESFHHLAKLRVIEEYKESVCQVFETLWDNTSAAARPTKPFEFPDGYNRFFGEMRMRVPEMLFQPDQFLPENYPRRDEFKGLPDIIYNSVASCDVDLRPQLLNSIVVTGGNTLLQTFTDRLTLALQQTLQPNRIRLHAPGGSMERRCGSWVGGSILASLGTFHQMWVSRREFEESGLQIVERKCQ